MPPSEELESVERHVDALWDVIGAPRPGTKPKEVLAANLVRARDLAVREDERRSVAHDGVEHHWRWQGGGDDLASMSNAMRVSITAAQLRAQELAVARRVLEGAANLEGSAGSLSLRRRIEVGIARDSLRAVSRYLRTLATDPDALRALIEGEEETGD